MAVKTTEIHADHVIAMDMVIFVILFTVINVTVKIIPKAMCVLVWRKILRIHVGWFNVQNVKKAILVLLLLDISAINRCMLIIKCALMPNH